LIKVVMQFTELSFAADLLLSC